MSKPDLENGYTSIANELLEAISRMKLHAGESSLLWTIVRLTYGWHRSEVDLSINQIAKWVGTDPKRIYEARVRLVARNMLNVSKPTIPSGRKQGSSDCPPTPYEDGAEIPSGRKQGSSDCPPTPYEDGAEIPQGSSDCPPTPYEDGEEIPSKRKQDLTLSETTLYPNEVQDKTDNEGISEKIPSGRKHTLTYSLQTDYTLWASDDPVIPSRPKRTFRPDGIRRVKSRRTTPKPPPRAREDLKELKDLKERSKEVAVSTPSTRLKTLSTDRALPEGSPTSSQKTPSRAFQAHYKDYGELEGTPGLEISVWHCALITEYLPGKKRLPRKAWAIRYNTILNKTGMDKLIAIEILQWGIKDPYWRDKLKDPDGFERHHDRIALQMSGKKESDETEERKEAMYQTYVPKE